MRIRIQGLMCRVSIEFRIQELVFRIQGSGSGSWVRNRGQCKGVIVDLILLMLSYLCVDCLE